MYSSLICPNVGCSKSVPGFNKITASSLRCPFTHDELNEIVLSKCKFHNIEVCMLSKILVNTDEKRRAINNVLACGKREGKGLPIFAMTVKI